MEFQFNTRDYQEKAIQSVVDLFDGQPTKQQKLDNSFSSQMVEFGNQMKITSDKLKENLNSVQRENNRKDAPIEVSQELTELDYSIEMETGTGKTYVYLNTIVELAKKFDWKKYIIVVPSVAIREGVKTEFDRLKNKLEADSKLSISMTVYGSRNINELETYHNSNMLEIMLITMQSFNNDKNVLYKETADLSVGKPIRWIQNVNPIVILDEPQNIGKETRSRLKEFNPLFVLRYSATHKELINPIYRYTPIDAYHDEYVKKIEVLSIFGNEFQDVKSYVEVTKIDDDKNGIFAQIKLYKYEKSGTKIVSRKLRHGKDLYKESGYMPEYQGYKINNINNREKFVEFDNGVKVEENELSQNKDALMKIQINETIRAHLYKEKQLAKEGIKVLSLFFIDKVKNYRDSNADDEKGKIKKWFEEEYEKITNERAYQSFSIENLNNINSIEEIQGAYFSKDKKNKEFKDSSNRTTKADEDTYDVIMKNKEKLLSFDNPIRFIFSHSALREGWDNPNVFQICTLNETKSNMKKRQEIGRGLRLPVDQNGNRIHDTGINILTVAANQSYEVFAKGLQEEITEDTGIETTRVPVENARERKKVKLNKQALLNSDFKKLWSKINKKTKYKIQLNDDELVTQIVTKLKTENFKINPRDYQITRTQMDTYINASEEGTVHEVKSKYYSGKIRIPNVVKRIADNTGLTKRNIIKIIKKSNIEKNIFIDPDKFTEKLTAIINEELPKLMVDGIKYSEINDYYEASLFKDEIEVYKNSQLASPLLIKDSMYPRTLYDLIQLDSKNEVNLINQFRNNPSQYKFFFKLPEWFKIATPAGNYNPDWALIYEEEDKEKLYLIRESKSTEKSFFSSDNLRKKENLKIQYGKKHFDTVGVNYQVIENSNDVKNGVYSFDNENADFSKEEKAEFISNLKIAKNFSVSYEQAYEQYKDEFHKFNVLREDYESL